ncbi:MAG: cytochrome c biogenesis protein CcsA [Thermoflexales bacterium]|nr:cytochrome c biogenesis protein CcsA [Thermoflexales bacterium]MCS7324809.1 cytochrome c biogenesis protein CcsA [Thermoflexales bacterium]MCX7939155.1 cytochrome c biogenesis protein CcsA [Thermoflexales bacterium]MDW8053133.1 cytochrome c biogenesis protein CcsA [Anaerolineae bacterium]MDW8291785.1 cytochrome c biogenesis protein CcsA [Anaerolineae bacterium]
MQGVVPLARPNRLDVTTRTLGVLAVALVVLALGLVFFVAPSGDVRSGGEAQRIFYFHISSAWVGFGAWLLTAVFGIRYLQTRDMVWDRRAYASAEVGVVFITTTLLSGMLWGRPTWNTWWTWDFKLTLTALQFLMYVAYLMLRSGIENPERRARFASVYGIIGSLTIPLNFVISRVLQSIHPAVFGPSVNAAQQGGFGVSGDRMLVLVVSMVALTVVYLFLVRARIALLAREEALSVRKAALVEA